jgi:hypothetical protein
MSDNGEIEVESQGYPVLPKEVTEEIGSIKLFNKVCTHRGRALRLELDAERRLTARSGPTRRSRSATSRSRTFPEPHPPSVRAHIEYYNQSVALYTLAPGEGEIALLRSPSAN